MSGQQVFDVPVAWWWKVTKYIYSSTVLEYNLDVLVLYLIISVCNATLYFYSAAIQREAFYYLLSR